MKNKEDILKYLKNEGENLQIPQKLEPDQMKRILKQQSAQKSAKKHKAKSIYKSALTAAACFCVIVIGMSAFGQWKNMSEEKNRNDGILQEKPVEDAGIIMESAEVGIAYPEIRYEDIYHSMSVKWSEQEKLARGEMNEAGLMIDGVVAESAAEESAPAADLSAEKSMNSYESEDFGDTNVQTVGVDEGDIVKNDGRYLYQKICVKNENVGQWAIQIVDTKEGLSEASRVEGFNNIQEFYVWQDTMIVIEEKYLEQTSAASKGPAIACADVAYFANYYHEISFFDIKDRINPKEVKTFTLQGDYASSRIADGYFYGFSKYYANPGKSSSDYDSYIPVMDGIRMEANKIYLPEKTDATSYMVLVAIDMSNPTKFTDTTGIVCDANLYYVSSNNIFVADTKNREMKKGWITDTTELLRFSYGDGKFALHAIGEVKGHLEGSFSMDEYDDHLRVVTTVWESLNEEVVDDRTGEVIGWNTMEDRQTNALYVLNDALKVVGQIEGLAENEQIYSARFMEETGYFVTFRQTDPLFTVDLKDPEHPKVLSELKVSGFSEYLHIYGEDRLLGIGMEADEETGAQKGMKLSVFDVSDKSNVTEIAKKNLTAYNYSEALYNHKAVLINPSKNVFGFAAEGSDSGQFYRKYFVFTYENDTFVQKLKVDAKNADGNYYSVRGTYIGDVFYLLLGDGSVKSYDLNTGVQLESLEP